MDILKDAMEWKNVNVFYFRRDIFTRFSILLFPFFDIYSLFPFLFCLEKYVKSTYMYVNCFSPTYKNTEMSFLWFYSLSKYQMYRCAVRIVWIFNCFVPTEKSVWFICAIIYISNNVRESSSVQWKSSFTNRYITPNESFDPPNMSLYIRAEVENAIFPYLCYSPVFFATNGEKKRYR